MGKIVNFIDDDKELVDKIKEYQKAHGLSSFVAAVRKLCKDALQVEKITHQGKTLAKNSNLEREIIWVGQFQDVWQAV